MQLLVSVRSAEEASHALAGGADIIDAKEPEAGALGAVAHDTFAEVVARVAGAVTVSAAAGDVDTESAVEARVRAFAAAGAAFVKIGFAGVSQPPAVCAMIAAAVRGVAAKGARVVPVAYADFAAVGSASPHLVAEAAAMAGAYGVLLDTAVKAGGGLLQVMSEREVRRWVDDVRAAGLMAALAGKLSLADVAALGASGADVIGVRGAACDGGRAGRITCERVRALSAALRGSTNRTPPTVDSRAARAESGRRRQSGPQPQPV